MLLPLTVKRGQVPLSGHLDGHSELRPVPFSLLFARLDSAHAAKKDCRRAQANLSHRGSRSIGRRPGSLPEPVAGAARENRHGLCAGPTSGPRAREPAHPVALPCHPDAGDGGHRRRSRRTGSCLCHPAQQGPGNPQRGPPSAGAQKTRPQAYAGRFLFSVAGRKRRHPGDRSHPFRRSERRNAGPGGHTSGGRNHLRSRREISEV